MTLYAHVQDGEIMRINITLPTSIGNTFIPEGAEFPELFPLVGGEPEYDHTTQRLSGPSYQIIGNTVERVYVVENIPAEELAATRMAEVITAMEALYDTTAKERRYDNRYTCALRAGYTGPFQAEGIAFATWMDNCNAIGYQIVADVQAAIRPMPTVAEVLSELPAIVWPT